MVPGHDKKFLVLFLVQETVPKSRELVPVNGTNSWSRELFLVMGTSLWTRELALVQGTGHVTEIGSWS